MPCLVLGNAFRLHLKSWIMKCIPLIFLAVYLIFLNQNPLLQGNYSSRNFLLRKNKNTFLQCSLIWVLWLETYSNLQIVFWDHYILKTKADELYKVVNSLSVLNWISECEILTKIRKKQFAIIYKTGQVLNAD